MARPRKDAPKELSRQRLFQKKRSEQGLCEICGGVNVGPYPARCVPCMKKQIDIVRKPNHKAWVPGSSGRQPLWWKELSEDGKRDIRASVGV